MDAIDRLFAEFELVFHNQYQKAYPTPEKLIYAKKLWFEYLQDYRPEAIVAAASQAVRESEYLPTIASLLKYCGGAGGLQGVPDAYSAYREACNAPQPKAEYGWSHPLVYCAGAASDWYFLATTGERQAFPVFARHYRDLCEQLARGEPLPMPSPHALAKPAPKPLAKGENQRRLRELRKQTGI